MKHHAFEAPVAGVRAASERELGWVRGVQASLRGTVYPVVHQLPGDLWPEAVAGGMRVCQRKGDEEPGSRKKGGRATARQWGSERQDTGRKRPIDKSGDPEIEGRHVLGL